MVRHQGTTVSAAERLLSAADACFRRSGLASTTVEDVATEAGLSRSTFYRHFPDLDAVVIRLAVEEGRQQLEAAVALVTDEATLTDKLTGVAVFMISRGMERPNTKALVTGPGALETVNAVLNDPDALTEISAPLQPLLAWGAERDELRPDLTFDEIAEWLLRNMWSLNIAPARGGWTEERLGRLRPRLRHPRRRDRHVPHPSGTPPAHGRRRPPRPRPNRPPPRPRPGAHGRADAQDPVPAFDLESDASRRVSRDDTRDCPSARRRYPRGKPSVPASKTAERCSERPRSQGAIFVLHQVPTRARRPSRSALISLWRSYNTGRMVRSQRSWPRPRRRRESRCRPVVDSRTFGSGCRSGRLRSACRTCGRPPRAHRPVPPSRVCDSVTG